MIFKSLQVVAGNETHLTIIKHEFYVCRKELMTLRGTYSLERKDRKKAIGIPVANITCHIDAVADVFTVMM